MDQGEGKDTAVLPQKIQTTGTNDPLAAALVSMLQSRSVRTYPLMGIPLLQWHSSSRESMMMMDNENNATL